MKIVSEASAILEGVSLGGRMSLWLGIPSYLLVSLVIVIPGGQRSHVVFFLTLLGVVLYGMGAWVYEIYLRRRNPRAEPQDTVFSE